MALGCKKGSARGRKRQKRNPPREESETKEEGVPTTTTISFHMCEVPEGLPFTGQATQPPPQMPLTQLQSNPVSQGFRPPRDLAPRGEIPSDLAPPKV